MLHVLNRPKKRYHLKGWSMAHKLSTCTFAEIDVKDPEGRLFVRQTIETATQKNDWVEQTW